MAPQIVFAHVTYNVTSYVPAVDSNDGHNGCPRIVAQDAADSSWRGQVFFTRIAAGWYYSSNNLGTLINNPVQVAQIDAVHAALHAEVKPADYAIVRRIAKLISQSGPDATNDYLNNKETPANVFRLAEILGCKVAGTNIVAAIRALETPAEAPKPAETETPHKHRATVIDRAIAQNKYITDSDVDASQTLREVALDFVKTYRGRNTFAQDVAVRLVDYGRLSVAQMRGVLNVMVAEAKAARIAPDAFKINFAEVPAPAANDTPVAKPLEEAVKPVVPNGTYTVEINTYGEYRVIRIDDCPESFNKPAGTQIAAYQNGPDNEANFEGFAFVNGSNFTAWKRFRNARDIQFALTKLLTSGNHGEYGKVWAMKAGRCFICGRKLTVPISKEAGIGPICAANTGIDINALAALNIGKADENARAKAQADIDELFPE